MSGVLYPPYLCFPNPRPTQPDPNKQTKRQTLTHKVSTLNVSEGKSHYRRTQPTAAGSEEVGGPEKSLRAPPTVWRRLFHLRSTLSSPQSHLVVDHHHVMAVCAQPGVHGLADAADFVQGWGVVVRPAEVQHLGIKLADVITLLTEVEELWRKYK